MQMFTSRWLSGNYLLLDEVVTVGVLLRVTWP